MEVKRLFQCKLSPWFFLGLSFFIAVWLSISIYAWTRPIFIDWHHAIVVASTGYLLFVLLAGGPCFNYGRGVLFALFWCYLGDVFGPGRFILGLFFFLVGHFGFIFAFVMRGLSLRRFGISVLPLGVVFLIAYRWLAPHVPEKEFLSFFLYFLVIGGMVVAASSSRPGPVTGLIILAAVIFLFSDLCLARTRYVEKHQLNALIGYPCYYLACTLFAWTVFLERRTLLKTRRASSQDECCPNP